jgi:hypothetical protein
MTDVWLLLSGRLPARQMLAPRWLSSVRQLQTTQACMQESKHALSYTGQLALLVLLSRKAGLFEQLVDRIVDRAHRSASAANAPTQCRLKASAANAPTQCKCEALAKRANGLLVAVNTRNLARTELGVSMFCERLCG